MTCSNLIFKLTVLGIDFVVLFWKNGLKGFG